MTDKLTIASNAISEAKTAQAILEIPHISDLWVQRYEATTGNKDGILRFENEKLHYLKVFQANPKLDKLEPFSKYAAFFDLCASDLTLADGESYILSFDNKTVSFKPSWKGRFKQISQMPSIAFPYQPEVVYDCDEFELTIEGPIKKIRHTPKPALRTKESKIIHVYMYVEFANGRVVPYEMSAFDVENIRNTRSKSYINYMKAFNNKTLNPNKVIGDRMTVEYINPQNQTKSYYDIDCPMWFTDEAQAYKKTLVHRVYGSLPKTKKQQDLDDQLAEKIKSAKSELGEDAPIGNMPVNEPEENVAADEPITKAEEEEFTEYEEVNGEQINTSTGEITEDDLEGDSY